MLDVSSARALLARTRPYPSREGYPAEVRSEVTQLARHLLSLGRCRSHIARDLGLHCKTLQNWLEDPSPSGASFVPIFFAQDEPVVPTCGTVTLVSPSGYRIEGLDFDRAVAALARLH